MSAPSLAPENITNGSDTGNPGTGSWSLIMNEAVKTETMIDPDYRLSLKDVMCMPTHAAVETVAGLGINPWLKVSNQGKLRAPGGELFELNITEACFKWANVKCMADSPAFEWGVTKTSAASDDEFMREIINCASQMNASGVGLLMLLASVLSGTLRDKLREILVQSFADDEKWDSLCSWTKWRMRDPLHLSDLERRRAIADSASWSRAWLDIAKEVVAGLYPSESGSTIDALRGYSKYGSLMKRKKFASVDVALLEEVEVFGLLKANEVVIPWKHRRETRNHILRTVYGPLVVSLLVQLEACENCPAWDCLFKTSRLALDPFIQVEPSRSLTPLPDNNTRRAKPSRIKQRRSQEMKYERKLRETLVNTKESNPPAIVTGTVKCFNCGGPHWKRDCPTLAQEAQPLRRSARIANNSGKPVNKGLGLIGQYTKEEPNSSERDVRSEYVSADEQGRSDDDEYKSDPSDQDDGIENGLGLFGPSLSTRVRSVILECNGKPLRFVLDSGADLSLIKRQHINPSSVVKSTNVVLEGLAGKVNIRQLMECHFKFGKRDLGVIDVLPQDIDGLLGIDLIDDVDIPAVIEFRKAYESLQEGLQRSTKDTRESTWTPIFEYTSGPLSESDLRLIIADLKLPIMDCSFDSYYPTIRERGRPTPFKWRAQAADMLENLINDGVLKELESDSDGWFSPGIFIPKFNERGDMKLRFVIDYKTVNKRVIKSHTATYPHTASTLISSIHRSSEWFSKVDIKNAFFNLPLANGVKHFLGTSIVVHGKERLFEMQKGPQGFSETPIWWVSFIDAVIRALRKILRKKFGIHFDIRAYVDDLLVFAESEKMCQVIHDSLIQYLRCLGIPFGKVVEPCREVEVIGLIFSHKGVRMARTDSMKDLSIPKDKSQLRTALGVYQYVRKAYDVKLFVKHTGTLSKLLRKTEEFLWTQEAQEAWDWLTHGFENVYFQYFSQEDQLSEGECFIIQTDASDMGISSVLWVADAKPGESTGPEWFNEHAKLLNTKCRVFNQEEAKYPTWDKEALGIFEALNTYGSMLTCAINRDDQLYVLSDSNAALQRWRRVLAGGVIDEDCTAGPRARRWHRWVDDLSIIFQLSPKFLHIAGDNNQVADFFSRALQQVSADRVPQVKGLGLIGTVVRHPTVPTNEESPFMSDLLNSIKLLSVHETNDDQYQGRLIREILLTEDDKTAFRVVDGVPYLCATGAAPRIYVPKGRATLGGEEVDPRVALIALAHQCHEGIARTTTNLRGYYWPRMSQLISSYIKSCEHCQKKNIKANYGKITGRCIPQRFDRIVIDHASPSCIGINPGGKVFRHTLIIVDSFSRYTRMIPVHSMETGETVDHLLRWSLDFGFPREIVSDNANSLRNALIEKALSITSRVEPGIHRWLAPVCYPQSQGEAERIVRELKSYIKIRNSDKWPQLLPFLSFAHNSAIYGSTGISPHAMVFGSEPTKLVDLTAWPVYDNLAPSAEDYLKELKSKLSEYHDLYRMKMEEYRTLSRDYYNQAHPVIQYEAGDKVWVVIHNNFRTDVTGPTTIQDKRGDHLYVVDDKLVPLQHLVPYVTSSEVDRRGIPFAESAMDNSSAIQTLLKVDVRRLAEGDLVLVQRGRNSQDIYEYDVAVVINNYPDTETLVVDLMTVEGLRRWKRTGLHFTFGYQSVLASGFKLTRTNELRASTLRAWRSIGLVE